MKNILNKIVKINYRLFINQGKTMSVKTEDLGKSVEYAICEVLETKFNGKFSYCQERVQKLKNRFKFLQELFEGYAHVGHKDNLNDFEKESKGSSEDSVFLEHLSVKTTKKKNDWKICPQLIGQPTRFTFCQKFGLDLGSEENPKSKKAVLSDAKLKDYILENISNLMKEYTKTTFHCPIFFYNEESDKALIIKKTSTIPWESSEFRFSHLGEKKGKKVCGVAKAWNESTTLYIRKKDENIPIGEFQFHQHRDCIKFRFHLKNVLDVFKESFDVKTY
jgi:hypothetical protein